MIMPSLKIDSKFCVSTFCDKKIEIPVKQGTYEVIVKNEDIMFILEGEKSIDDLKMEYFGEKDYASIFSDFHFVKISDKKTNIPDLELEWIADNVVNCYEFKNAFIFEIPCGTGGCLSVYVYRNDKDQIVCVRINGVAEEDSDDLKG